MGAIAIGLVETPGQVGETEADQQPAGNVAAEALDALDAGDCPAGGDADRAERHRAGDVADAAGGGDPQRAPQRPAARLAHGDERHVVIRPEDRMEDADDRRGRE